MKTIHTLLTAIGCLCLVTTGLRAQVPQFINHQGRVNVGGVNFEGTGQFRFALVNGNGTTTFWSNDGTSVAGSQPTAAVALTVTKGLYSVLLGNTALPNMTAVPATVFSNPDVRLRVWFNDGTHGPQLLTPDERLAAVGYSMIAGTVPDGSITNPKLAPNAVQSGNIAPGAVGTRELATDAVKANLADRGQSGVASGGVVFSPTENPALLQAGYVKIGVTQLAESWRQRNDANAPAGRSYHTVVWTGSEMIVWGGDDNTGELNTGGRYHAATNTWTALPTPALAARATHTAVWTGSEMIIWGGYGADFARFNDGSRYNPATNSWTLIANSLPNTPTQRFLHTAVWTGNEMIIWGGTNGGALNSGGRYNPVANAWTVLPTSNAPSARRNHTAVWTGSEMIVWGGENYILLSDGGRYNPAGNSWSLISSTLSYTPAGRESHTAVWTGSEMIVWGGINESFDPVNDGGRYNPAGNGWTLIPSTLPNTPAGRESHTAVWTGSEMIVWGGLDDNGFSFYDGGRYNPAANSWTLIPSSLPDTPASYYHTAVWTGSEMIVWGGLSSYPQYRNDTFIYTPEKGMFLYQKP